MWDLDYFGGVQIAAGLWTFAEGVVTTVYFKKYHSLELVNNSIYFSNQFDSDNNPEYFNTQKVLNDGERVKKMHIWLYPMAAFGIISGIAILSYAISQPILFQQTP